MGTEIELKLLIDSASLPKLRRHPLLKSLCRSKAVRQKLYSVYFDTPGQALRRSDAALRLRREHSSWTQTVKGGGRVQAGLHQRLEDEAGVAADVPDFDKIADPALRRLFTPQLRRRLRPVFVTDFWRTTWLLEFSPDERVELALDLGEIRAGDQCAPIGEVELELKSGSPGRLFELALELQQSIPLRVENRSKAERGYALLAPSAPGAVKARPPRLSRHMTVSEALREILGECLNHLQDNVNGVLRSDDAEGLHQMRVAVRRLLSALRLRGAAAAPAAEILQELRWLMSVLGPARDWDVFLGETLPPILGHFSDHSGLAALEREALRLRAAARQAVREAVTSRRYTRLVLTLGGWLAAEHWREPPTGGAQGMLSAPVSGFARDLLSRRHKRLLRRGRRLAVLDAGGRHALRIAAKKLRYSVEFFAGLFPRRAAGGYLKALMALQDVLGQLNDAAVTRSLLEGLRAGCSGPAADEARGIVAGWAQCGAVREMQVLETVWKDLKGYKVFW